MFPSDSLDLLQSLKLCLVDPLPSAHLCFIFFVWVSMLQFKFSFFCYLQLFWIPNVSKSKIGKIQNSQNYVLMIILANHSETEMLQDRTT